MVLSRSTCLVWLKRLSAFSLIFFLVACSSEGRSSNGTNITPSTLILSWAAPSNRVDGSTIESTEISGYSVHYGTVKGVYPNKLFVSDEKVIGADVEGIAAGSYFVVITTIDTNGRESDFSTEHEVSL